MVAYEWIGTAGATVLGLAGITATLLAGKFERGHSERMTREAREQERLADAYVRLLVLVERIGQWANMVKPMWDTIPPQPVRPLPDLDEQAEAEAVVNAFGSDDVLKVFEAWRGIMRDIVAAVGLIELECTGTDFGDEPYSKLYNLLPAEREAREALSRQVSRHGRSVESCAAAEERPEGKARREHAGAGSVRAAGPANRIGCTSPW